MKKAIMCMILAGIIFTASFFCTQTAIAEEDMVGTEYAAAVGIPRTEPLTAVGYIIRAAMGFLGVGALCLIIYSGFTWMTSLGNEEKVRKAKKTILTTMLGLGIILSSYAITVFVAKTFLKASLGGRMDIYDR